MISEFDLLSRYVRAKDKLTQFRRHSDWRRAFERTVPRFAVEINGKQGCIWDADAAALIDAADQEFIDEVIRTEKQTGA